MKKIDRVAADAKREYMRQWRAKNPEKVRAAQERYWRKQGEIRQKEREEAAKEGRDDSE